MVLLYLAFLKFRLSPLHNHSISDRISHPFHAVSDRVEAAYRRSDLFEKRPQLMNEWARYCYQRQKKQGIQIRENASASYYLDVNPAGKYSIRLGRAETCARILALVHSYSDTSGLPNRENSYNQHQKMLENDISSVVTFVRGGNSAAPGPVSAISLCHK